MNGEFPSLEVVCLGEALVDLISVEKGVPLVEARIFEKAPGGAPANVAVGLARLGIKSGFISKVGDDDFGHFLVKVLEANGVDVSHIDYESKARTALAFVSLSEDGERKFLFYRNPAADMFLAPEELDPQYIQGVRIFHFGSVSLATEPSRQATLMAAQLASKSSLLVTYDPNVRLALWESYENAKRGVWEGLRLANVVKVSQDELEFITGDEALEKGARRLIDAGVDIVVVSLGALGSYYDTPEKRGYVEGFQVPVLDTTGAGDGFMAGFLASMLWELKKGKSLNEIRAGSMGWVLQFANAVGALTTLKFGAISALPTREEVLQFLSQRVGVWENLGEPE